MGDFESFQPLANNNNGYASLGTKLRNNNSSTSKIIYYLQTGVLATEKTKPYNITVKFLAPFVTDPDDDEKLIIDYSQAEDDVNELELLQNGEFQRFAEIQTMKMAHYLQQVRQIEILKMQAEYVRDDCDNIWFIYANKIVYQRCEKTQLDDGDLAQEELEAEQLMQQQTEMFMRELQEY